MTLRNSEQRIRESMLGAGDPPTSSIMADIIEETPYGVFQGHAYPYDDTMSTFIVETGEDTWRRAGLDSLTPGPLPPGVSDEASVDVGRELARVGDANFVVLEFQHLNK